MCWTHEGVSKQIVSCLPADLLMPASMSARAAALLSMSCLLLHHSPRRLSAHAPLDTAAWGMHNASGLACTEATLQQAGSTGCLRWPAGAGVVSPQCYRGRTQRDASRLTLRICIAPQLNGAWAHPTIMKESLGGRDNFVSAMLRRT